MRILRPSRAADHAPVRRLLARAVPTWAKPRLGLDEPQYPPRVLTVPRRYARAKPPSPAPSVSLITPCLNQAAFVAQAVGSVLIQGYPRLEYVVMDGASEDGSLDRLESYRPQLARLESRPDSGQAAAINAGFADSTGEIMGWLNADDLLLPGALAYVARHFAEHPEVDVVYGHRIVIDERGQDIGIWVTPRHCAASVRWYDFIPQETAFWRRELWDRLGGIDERYDLAFDWDLFLRFHVGGARIVRLPRFLGAFRLHAAQKSRVQAESALRELDLIRERWNGRPVSLDEAHARVDLFRLRSLAYYAGYRLARRVPMGRLDLTFADG